MLTSLRFNLRDAVLIFLCTALSALLIGCGGGDGPAPQGNSSTATNDKPNADAGTSGVPAKPMVMIPDELVLVAEAGNPHQLQYLKLGEKRIEPAQMSALVEVLKANAARAAEAGQPMTTFRVVAPPWLSLAEVEPALELMARVPFKTVTLVARADAGEAAELAKRFQGIPLKEAQAVWTPAVGQGAIDPKKLRPPLRVVLAQRGEWGVGIDMPQSAIAPRSMDEVRKMLGGLHELNGGAYSADWTVIVQATEQVPWMYVVQAIEAIQKAKFNDVQLARGITFGTPTTMQTTKVPTKSSGKGPPPVPSPKITGGEDTNPKRSAFPPISRFLGLNHMAARRVVFVIDGPMEPESVRTWLGDALTQCIKNFKQEQAFNIIVSGKDNLLLANEGWLTGGAESQEKLAAWLGDTFAKASTEAGGGSRLIQAMTQALALEPNVIYLVSRQPLGEGEHAATAKELVESIAKANLKRPTIHIVQVIEQDGAGDRGQPVLEWFTNNTAGRYRFFSKRELGLD
ncbi:MAG: hypothetical protein WD768_12340 [Phycisphaeraceae bacterium]